MDFGTRIKHEREAKNLLLREVASFAKMDTALLSKIERGKRTATRDQVLLLVKLFEIDEEEMINLWIGHKIAYLLLEEESPLKILRWQRKL
jgi:transcriptional regulator with XRE-family HTH domain